MKHLSAYVHIPFCTHKCDFCDFAAFAGLDHLATEYCDIVCHEIEQRLSGFAKLQLTSIFYGGGTPGLIHPELLAGIHNKLVGKVTLAKDSEVTLETTPHAITPEKAREWLKLGINRLSIGVETLNDEELRSIGRDHSEKEAIDGIRMASEAGFSNISCDLMHGLPTQTISSWRTTLRTLLSLAQAGLPITHISAYGLQLASNSPLYSRFPKNSRSYPDEDLCTKMYQILVAMMKAQGFFQYEISNFSLPGFQSRHNLGYWHNHEYLGFGVSAHRYVNRVRSSNWRSLTRYMNDYTSDETSEFIGDETRVREAIMLGLRLRQGIDLRQFLTEYDVDLESRFAVEIERFQSGQFMEIKDGRLALTQEGVLVSNTVIAEFM